MKVNGGIVFLHGSGDSGNGFQDWIHATNESFLTSLKDLGYIFTFPSAKLRSYSLDGGELQTVWHDRTSLDIAGEEDIEGVCDAVHNVVDKCVESLVAKGAPVDRIFIFGLSMGGHVALQSLMYSEYISKISGVIGLSCFLVTSSPFWSGVAAKRNEGHKLPPILMMHGTSDSMVPLGWGAATSNRLKDDLRLDVIFEAIEGMPHDMCSAELNRALEWICTRQRYLESEAAST